MHTEAKKISFKECVVYNFGHASLRGRYDRSNLLN